MTDTAARSAANPATVDLSQAQPQVQIDTSERPLGELITQATADLSTLVRKEVELARAEISQDLDQAKRGGVLFGAAAALAVLALLLLSFAAAWGLAAVIPTGWAFAIVAVGYAIGAFIALQRAKREMRDFSPKPEQTIETLKEDIQWAKHPTS